MDVRWERKGTTVVDEEGEREGERVKEMGDYLYSSGTFTDRAIRSLGGRCLVAIDQSGIVHGGCRVWLAGAAV